MVNPANPPDISPPSFFKVLEGFTPGMWLELGALLSKFGDKEGMSPAELTEMVKKVLLSQQREGTSEPKDLSSLIKRLPSIESLPPDVVQIFEKLNESPKLDTGSKKEEFLKNELVSKSETAPKTEGPPKLSRPSQSENQGRGRNEGYLPKSELSSQSAVREVTKALNLLLPLQAPREEVKTPEPHEAKINAPKESSEPQFMFKNPNRNIPELKPQMKEKFDEQIHVTLNELKAGQSLENKTFAKQVPMAQEGSHLLLSNKNLAEFGKPNFSQTGSKAGEFSPHTQAPTPPSTVPRTDIPGVPYSPQSILENRRKEKKKLPKNAWDQEADDEDSPEKKYPRE